MLDRNKNWLLTTSDNPYSPVTDWDEWYKWDESHGYHTCEYLSRLVYSSPELSDMDQKDAMLHGMDVILSMNLTGNYFAVEY